MPRDLDRSDVRTIRSVPVPFAAACVAVLAAALLVALGTVSSSSCEPGCDPDPWSAALAGLLLAVVCAAWIQLWAAAVLAWAAVLAGSAGNLAGQKHGMGVLALGVLVAVIATGLAWQRSAAARSAAIEFHESGEVPPADPDGPVPFARGWLAVAAAVLIAGAGGFAAVAATRVPAAAPKPAAAGPRSVLLHRQPDGSFAGTLPDGHPIAVNPIGVAVDPGQDTITLALPDNQALQPVPPSEQPDTSPWIALAALLAALALAVAWRFLAANWGLRGVLRRPQPEFTATGIVVGREALVFPATGEDLGYPVLAIRLQDPARPGAAGEFAFTENELADPGLDGHDLDQLADPELAELSARYFGAAPEGELEPLTLIGAPVAGRWCAIRRGGTVLLPAGPARAVPTADTLEGEFAADDGS
jgi:hypothetical protein